jgi:hypothetical protein
VVKVGSRERTENSTLPGFFFYGGLLREEEASFFSSFFEFPGNLKGSDGKIFSL